MSFLWVAVAFASSDPASVALSAWRAQLPRSDVEVTGAAEVFAWPGGSRVRVSPSVDHLRVVGASQTVALDRDGVPIRIGGRPVPVQAVPRGPLGRVDALARAAVLAEQLGQPLYTPRVEEVALATAAGLVHGFEVHLGVAEPLGTWVAWLDAEDGAWLGVQRSSHDVDGRVFATNPEVGGLEVVELLALDGPDVLRGTFADVTSCTEPALSGSLFGVNRCEAEVRQAFPSGGAFLFNPAPGELVDPFAEVNLYHHVTTVAAWFDTRYGLRDAVPLQVIGNFPMANAFYGDFDGDGRGDLAFGVVCDGCGQGGPETRVNFAYDADVTYHEFAHWVVGRIADIPSLGADAYGLEWAGGSLNEGAADVFAMALTGDPQMGEYAGQAFGDGPIRDLDAGRRCPDDLRGEVHHDGQILAALGWDLIETIGPESASDLMFGAVAMWGPDITWELAGQSLLDAADDLRDADVLDADAHARAVAAIEASGMPGCGRVIPIDDGLARDPFILSAGLVGPLERLPGGTQFSVDLPVSPDRLVVEVSDLRAPHGLAWSLFVRCGAPVQHEPTELATFGLGFAVPTVWDWTIDGEGPTGQLVVDGSSDPPLPSEGTCYIAVAGRDAGPLEPLQFTLGRLELSARAEAAIHDEPPRRGCAHGVGGVGAFALLGALFVRKRRRAG